MLFLANMLSKMKHNTPLGSRIAEVHNGSSLFTGDAGSGESNVRRWIIENDWLEAIVALRRERGGRRLTMPVPAHNTMLNQTAMMSRSGGRE
jgi:hypothetical protein